MIFNTEKPGIWYKKFAYLPVTLDNGDILWWQTFWIMLGYRPGDIISIVSEEPSEA